MQHRATRITLASMILVGLSLTSAPAVAAQEPKSADLALSMTGPTRIKSTDDFAYTITVTNLGPGPATDLHISGGGGDWFNPVSLRCHDNGSSSTAGCDPNDLAAGSSVTATYTVNVCCLVRNEDRHAWLDARVGDRFGVEMNDPNLDNNYASLDAFIIGRRVR